ncbi:hypothetical protein GN956_G26347 [Arapaima gigas]
MATRRRRSPVSRASKTRPPAPPLTGDRCASLTDREVPHVVESGCPDSVCDQDPCVVPDVQQKSRSAWTAETEEALRLHWERN